MATSIGAGRRGAGGIAPDPYERGLAIGAGILLAAVLAAIARGHASWGQVPALVWAHIATIIVALALTPVMMVRPRGDRAHRLLGRVWLAAMLLTALLSFGIRLTNHGRFSVIHLLSVWTLIQVPIIWLTARRHQPVRHRRAVRGMVTGALLIAGFFTFPFGRLMGQWLFG